MSIQVEGTKQVILERADKLAPCERFYYLEQTRISLKEGVLQFIDTDRMVSANPELLAWISDYIQTQRIPENYFSYSLERLLEDSHPMMREQIRSALTNELIRLTKEGALTQAANQGFTQEQANILYDQMLAYIAMSERPAVLN